MTTAFGIAPRINGSKFFPLPTKRAAPKIVPAEEPSHSGKWTEAECVTLREFAGMGTAELEKHLPGRTRAAILNKAQSLGIAVKMIRRRGYKVMSKRGRITVPRHAHPLVREFFREANAQKKTFVELEGAGLGSGTVRTWTAKMPRLDTFIAALNHIGLDLKIVHTKPKTKSEIDGHIGIIADDDFRLILRRVAWMYDLTVESIVSGSRLARLVLARDECMWLARRHAGKSYTQIARMLCMDHTSIISGVRRHQARVEAAHGEATR